jgi:hypothetical protein
MVWLQLAERQVSRKWIILYNLENVFVTAIQGQVTQDQVLSLVQFKQVSNGAFINFWGTKIELFLNPNLEPRHLSWAKINLSRNGVGTPAFTLGSTLSMLSWKNTYIDHSSWGCYAIACISHVNWVQGSFSRKGSILYQKEKKWNSNCGRWRRLCHFALMLIVGPIARQNYWKPKAFSLNTYMARVAANAHLKFGDGGFIFRLLFLVSGNYIDQASSRLLFLGNPFS